MSLLLHPSAGWLFSPEEIEVSSDPQGACAKGVDIDFIITGFAIAGRVLTAGADTGPAGVRMVLTSAAGRTFSTETGEGGTFAFKDAPEGEYTLTASHPKWQFTTATSTVVATFGQAAIAETFGVLGYDVSGSVAWATGAPAAALPVLLKPKSAPKHASNPSAARPASLACKLRSAHRSITSLGVVCRVLCSGATCGCGPDGHVVGHMSVSITLS